MEFRNRETGAVITDRQFREINVNTSFPATLTTDLLESFGYDVVFEGPQATTTAPYEFSVRAGVEEINGKWYTKYIAGPVFSDITGEDGTVITATEQETEYRSRIDDEVAERVRQDRNKRLGDTDWTQLVDAPVDAVSWATYRQTLRDITTQDGFPHNVVWPEEPTT